MGSNLVVGTIDHKTTVNSAVRPSEVGKMSTQSNSEGTSTGYTLITDHLKFKCFILYKDSKSLLSLSKVC